MPPCPCHSGKPYAKCCEPYHLGLTPPPTALALMRSRYSAYALGLVDYIMDTTDNTHSDPREIEAFCNVTSFVDLEILNVDEKETEATVKFKAGLLQGSRDASFVETSTFVKKNNRWLYVSGCIN